MDDRPGSEFQSIYQEFEPRIRRYVRRLVGAGDAEDVTQDVFVKVSQALPRFRGDARIGTWIYRIATNTAFDRLRSRSLERARRRPCDGREALAGTPPDVDRELARNEMSGCIRQHVDALPPGYRSVILLSETEGLTNGEIADALGLSLPTVKIRLHRARRRLRSQLERACTVYRDQDSGLACEPRAERVSFNPRPPSTRSDRS